MTPRGIVTAVAAAAIGVLLSGSAAAQGTTYHVARQIQAGGEGGWDYLTVDTVGHRLYISRSTHVMVIDLAGDTVIGDIPNTPGVHGIAVAPDLNRGFVSNGRDSTVTVFDLRTLATVGTIRGTGRNPDAILYEPTTRRVFTFNGGSASATAIDAITDSIIGTIELGGKPEFARTDLAGHVYVNIEDKSEIVSFDPRTLQVLAHWPLAPCQEPSGLAIDRAHRLLFTVCSNALMAIVDARNGSVLTTLPTGQGTDGAAFDPGPGLAFSSNGDGTMTLVREDGRGRFSVAGNVPTLRGARTMTVDEQTHRVYTVSAQFGPAPAPTPERPRPRPPMIPGTFTVLVLER